MRRLHGTIVCAGLGLLVASCAQIIGLEDRPALDESGPGTCEGTLNVRILANHTGPTADVDDPKTVAIVDVLDSINAGGGIHGCQIDYGEIGDASYVPANAATLYDGWRRASGWDDVSAIFANGTPVIGAVARAAEEDHKVVMATSFSAAHASPQPVSHEVDIPHLREDFEEVTRADQQKSSDGYPYLFFQGTDYSTAARGAMDFVVQQGGRRIGFFYDFESSYAAPPVEAAKTYLATQPLAIGRDLDVSMDLSVTTVEAVRTAAIEYFTAEFEHQLQEPDYVAVDWLWFGNTRASASVTCQAMAGVSEHFAANPIDGIDTSGFVPKVIANNWAVDELTHSETGGACSGNWWVVQPFALYGDMSAIGMSELLRTYDTYRTKSTHLADEDPALIKVVSYVVGYVTARTWELAATAAVERGERVTGATLKASLEALDNQNLDGLTAGPISYTPDDHRPQSRVYVYRLASDGKLEQDGIPIDTPLKSEWLGW